MHRTPQGWGAGQVHSHPQGKACFHFWFFLAFGHVEVGGWEPDFCPGWGRVPTAVYRCRGALFCPVSQANPDARVIP